MKNKNNMKQTLKMKLINHYKPALALAAVCAALWNVAVQAQPAVSVYDTDDSFVLNPGPGNSSYPNAASQNFGGMNSRSVASPTAHPGNNPANPSKGEFDSVLRFDFSSTVATLNSEYGVGDWSISSLSLTLNTSSTVGNSMFNSPGTSGNFNVSWLSNDGGWIQGTGSQSPASYTGITYNSLQSTLSATPASSSSPQNISNQGRAPAIEFNSRELCTMSYCRTILRNSTGCNALFKPM